jgi:dTDP-4-amino-4,6-dideoxygalactose transaminase
MKSVTTRKPLKLAGVDGLLIFQRFVSLASLDMIPVTDPLAQYRSMQMQINGAVSRVMESGYYILGPEVESFEHEFANYIGTEFAVGVGNGTDALSLTLRALGVGDGDEVITVSHTAVATVAAIEQCGATPILIDVEQSTLTLDASMLESAFTERTKAVVPVHLYGHPADLSNIEKFCDKYGLALIEDASQAHGATYDGKRLGSFGQASVFSCYPTKNLGALGDAGVMVTNDRQLADRVRRLRQYGWEYRNSSVEPGVNSRLDELQAAVLRAKLPHLDQMNERRRQIALRYCSAFAELDLDLPVDAPLDGHVFHLFVVRVSDRTQIQERLLKSRIKTAIHYPIPIHKQAAYMDRVRVASSMDVTEREAERVLSLPMYPELLDSSIREVIGAVSRAIPVHR